MYKPIELRMRPCAPWRTYWRADTLFGSLCWMCAHTRGEQFLRDRWIDPCIEGHPPVVFSDGFQPGVLPVPAWFRYFDWPAEIRKSAGASSLVSVAGMEDVRCGKAVDYGLLKKTAVRSVAKLHNTLDRLTGTTGEEGSLFEMTDLAYANAAEDANIITVYARVEPERFDELLDLMFVLGRTGFGADSAIGRGQFELLEPMDADWLDATPNESDAIIVLSTFQPGCGDPTDGLWQISPKAGRLGHGFGLENFQVQKSPMLMLSPGACFKSKPCPSFVGRAIPMGEFLPDDVAGYLAGRGAQVIHPAFGLPIAAKWPDWARLSPLAN